MEHSIALVTGATSGLGYAAARLLAAKGYREVIVTGRRLAQIKETTVQLAAGIKRQVFTPLELDLNDPANVQSAVTALVKQGRPVDFLLLNAGLVPYKQRVLTAAGVEASQAPLIGHHQLTVGLLNANLLNANARIVIAGAEPARGGVPMFKYTDLPEFAAKHFQNNRTAAVEALIRNGPNVMCRTTRMRTRSSSSPGGLLHWRAGCPPAWPFTLSRPVGQPPPRWCEAPARC
jgi:NAD(P)-dependent dehydrogenase (short-subunit alcohol dehydrogenase family)